MPALSTCRDEVESLHAFFVDWFTGDADADPDDDFARVADALAPDFELVTPDGERLDREAVLAGIREMHGRHDPGTFAIEVRDVGLVAAMGEHALVRYEEWQETDERDDTRTTGRVSTALFRDSADAPGGIVWVALHETWIDADA